MKGLKSLMAVSALLIAGSAMGQDYNRVGISYNNDHYGYSKNFYGNDKDRDPSFSSNGGGLNYVHGFRLKRSLPMYIEVGGDINFGFKSVSRTEHLNSIIASTKYQFQNINLTVPVNFAWKFNVGKDFYITPYIGINGKFNFVTRERKGVVNGKVIWEDWKNILKKDKNNDIKKGDTWRVFQMGGQIGATFGWKHVSLGLQYGGDFIAPYSVVVKYMGLSERFAVNCTSFKLTLGYDF